MKYDFKKIEKKWQKEWSNKKAFEPEVEKKEKFFVTFPYPYVNLSPHIGHFYTIMRVEAFARYKRLRNCNVLFPQGWHCTGSPIVAAANRVKENEKKVIENLKKEGFSEKEIKKFEKPEYWIEVFSKKWLEDLNNMGLSIDWRRNFITTSLNPYYDKFIRWQFRKLKKKGYVVKGKHPVVWDPKTNMPVGDHDRVEGEGEVPQEFVLLKFKFNDEYIIAATLRPETVFGQTNLWVSPETEYTKAKIGKEVWIISRQCAEKLKQQDKNVEIIGSIKGKELLGKYAKAPAIKRDIVILPSSFCDPSKGTGIVTSVPSDAPDDYIGLRDLWENKKESEKYGINFDDVKKIKVIPIIDSEGLGDKAAVKVVEDMQIKNQNERVKLEKAKKIVYKKGFYEGRMNNNCGRYSGMKVEKAKDKVKGELLKNKEAELFYELTGKVVSRSLTECIVKIVSDQWFIKYSDEKWKKDVHKALKDIKLYPESVREQFSYVIDWLNDWACTREYGLGTRLPFDEQWLIESLSDSTIYMAYYTIAHLIKNLDINDVGDELFDYVFLGKGKGKKEWGRLKKEFDYWYPLDFRNSGKDLVQNHLTFFLFNHAAIFPKKNLPKSIGVNGWVRVEGQKMSKSLGNMIPLREMSEKFGADASRLTILNGGEGMYDPNWDSTFAKSLNSKFKSISCMILENYGKGREDIKNSDKWLESCLNKIILETTEFMEQTLFRSAIQKIFFELSSIIKTYLSKAEKPNKKIFAKAAESYIIMLSPFCPHFSEEIWEKIGKKGFVSIEKWPESEKAKIDEKLSEQEQKIDKLASDINNITKLVKEKGEEVKKAYVYLLPNEKDFYSENLKFIEKKTSLQIEIFAVNDKEKYDPDNKSGKVKPGRPGIYLE